MYASVMLPFDGDLRTQVASLILLVIEAGCDTSHMSSKNTHHLRHMAVSDSTLVRMEAKGP